MRARVGIAALVVASVALLGCSGDDEPSAGDGGASDRGAGDGGDVGALALEPLSTLPFAVDAAVRVDQGLLVASEGELRLVDAGTGEPFPVATTAAPGPTTTVRPGGADAGPEVVGLVASADGTPYALLGGPSCGVAEVDTADLGLGEVAVVEDVTCDDPVVLGDQLFLLSYGDAEGEVGPAGQAVPRYTYRLGTVALGSGGARSADITAAVEGYSLPFGSGLVRVGDEVDLVLQKVGDEATPYVITVDESLELGEPETRDDLEDHGERIAGEVFFARPVVVGEREWGFRVSEAGQAATIAVFEGGGSEPLGEVALPDDLGGSLLGDRAISLAADADGAYLLVAAGDAADRTTELYRIS